MLGGLQHGDLVVCESVLVLVDLFELLGVFRCRFVGREKRREEGEKKEEKKKREREKKKKKKNQ